MGNWFLNLLFPPRCASCKQEGDFLCGNCRGRLKLKPIQSRSLYPSVNDFPELDGVIYGLDYAENPEIQAAVKQFKYHFTQDLADYFGKLLSVKLSELSMLKNKEFILIPIPLHKKRLGERGFNQAELIAGAVIRYAGKGTVLNRLLTRTRYTSQQAKLKKAERQKNLDGAFEVAGELSELENKICFLVDDVCTTGSTLESCARALRKKGLGKVYGLVVARAFK
jgi:competence protein ComFC